METGAISVAVFPTETTGSGFFVLQTLTEMAIPTTITTAAAAGSSHLGSGRLGLGADLGCGVWGFGGSSLGTGGVAAFGADGFTGSGFGSGGAAVGACRGDSFVFGISMSGSILGFSGVVSCNRVVMSCGRFWGMMLMQKARTSNCACVSSGWQVRESSITRPTAEGGRTPVQQ